MILIHFAEKIVKSSSMSKRKAFFAFLNKKQAWRVFFSSLSGLNYGKGAMQS